MQNILLVGAGNMGEEYAKVLDKLDFSYDVVTRSKSRSDYFSKKFKRTCYNDGLNNKELNFQNYTHAIVAVPVQELKTICNELILKNIKNILAEKPAGLNSAEISELQGLADKNKAKIFVAYNRRFYASVIASQKIIEEDGGVLSCTFEFTEWSHIIEKLDTHAIVKKNWFLANSSHVVDLVFHIIGYPNQLNSFTSGKTSWYEPAIFAGSGVTDKNVLFSYGSNWNSAGRWRIELLTKNRKIVLCPLELLQEQQVGTIQLQEVENVDYQLDTEFKPGLFLQTKSFLNGDENKLKLLSEQVKSLEFFNKIEGRNN
jgi:predicted dehydrogenase